MKNMGGISLGQHKSIQLVVIGESYYLIGVGDDIRLLKEITDPEEIDKLSSFMKKSKAGCRQMGYLNDCLTKFTKRRKVKHTNTEESTDFSQSIQHKT